MRMVLPMSRIREMEPYMDAKVLNYIHEVQIEAFEGFESFDLRLSLPELKLVRTLVDSRQNISFSYAVASVYAVFLYRSAHKRDNRDYRIRLDIACQCNSFIYFPHFRKDYLNRRNRGCVGFRLIFREEISQKKESRHENSYENDISNE